MLLSVSCDPSPSEQSVSPEYPAPQLVETFFPLVVRSPFVRGQTSKDLVLPRPTLLSDETRQFGFFRLTFHGRHL